MSLRVLARLFIAAALLVAQQSAIAHQIWHVAAPAQQAAGVDPQDSDAGGRALCELHAALGAVLGALGVADAIPEFTAPQDDAVPAASPSQAPATALSPSSRGPPRLH